MTGGHCLVKGSVYVSNVSPGAFVNLNVCHVQTANTKNRSRFQVLMLYKTFLSIVHSVKIPVDQQSE